jgi:hypothetical protein
VLSRLRPERHYGVPCSIFAGIFRAGMSYRRIFVRSVGGWLFEFGNIS